MITYKECEDCKYEDTNECELEKNGYCSKIAKYKQEEQEQDERS